MTEDPGGFQKFVRTVLDAIDAAEVEYLIGGSVALWAWGAAKLGLSEIWEEMQKQITG